MDAKELPARPNLEQYKKQAKDLLKAYKSGDPAALRRVNYLYGDHYRDHYQAERALTWDELRAKVEQRLRRFGKLPDSEPGSAKFVLADAQFLIAREYGFESWPKFKKHIEAIARKNSPVSKFESAVDAVITGDAATLERLLRENPELIRARSTRAHHSTLLHHVSANGVEDFRQKAPKNAVEVAKILLKAGAEVDATADSYGGGSTTLGLTASSVHPKRAGVQDALIETLLDAGAAIDGLPGGGSPLMAAVANYCLEAAETLVRRGARVDNIVAAAALGRLDLVEGFLGEDGNLTAEAADVHFPGAPKEPKAQMGEAFIRACRYGQNSVADFLLEKGVDPSAGANTAQTGFHLAADAGHLDTVKLLIERKAPLEVRNVHGGTVLGQAMWSAINEPQAEHVRIIEALLGAGAKIEDGSLAWLAQQEGGSSSAKARIAELLRRHGAKS
jgi:ankyrin repeat protein